MKLTEQMESEKSSPTNFWITLSPDGRIDSIELADGDETGQMQSLFKATATSCLYRRQSEVTNLLVSIAPDGRFKSYRSSNTPLEDWDLNWYKSQHEKILMATLRAAEPDPGPVSEVWVDPEDPEADKKVLAIEKMGKVMPVRPVVKKASDKLNAAFPHLQEFAGWFGNAKRIPLSIDDENYDAKLEALEDAGFMFSPVGNIWIRP